MSKTAKALNEQYLQTMRAGKLSTLAIVRDFWWQDFASHYAKNGALKTLDALDLCMNGSRVVLAEQARKYAEAKVGTTDVAAFIQRTSQYTKSNTGKAFERFVGLALAHALSQSDSDYCIAPFAAKCIKSCHGLNRSDFEVDVTLGSSTVTTVVDADLMAFNPTDPTAQRYMLSIKSTLKDRFHNVPFWNMLRRTALVDEYIGVKARKPDVLDSFMYVAICSDLAKEQPDFGTAKGARTLLQVDAALLDGAFVTASTAQGVPADSNCLGPMRSAPFHRLSCFAKVLSPKLK